MVKDHYEALKFVLNNASEATKVDVSFIQKTNALVMKSTGKICKTVSGQIDGSKWEFRKGNVSAGNSYFVNYNKVESLTDQLVQKINEGREQHQSMQDRINLSFDAHFDLLTIHPFYDGTGRTSRLLMNFIQKIYSLPLCIVFKADKAEYFLALEETRSKENIEIFMKFMNMQYKIYLRLEIDKYEQLRKASDKDQGYSLIFYLVYPWSRNQYHVPLYSKITST